jgi:hypothetical protein
MTKQQRQGWLAGFLEGRGFSVRNGVHHKFSDRRDISLSLQTTQRSKFPLFEKFAKMTGVNFYKGDYGPAFAERTKIDNRPAVFTDGTSARWGVKLGARRSQSLIAEIGHLLHRETMEKLAPIIDNPVLSPREAGRIAGAASSRATAKECQHGVYPSRHCKACKREIQKKSYRKLYVPHPRDYSKQVREENGKFAKVRRNSVLGK